MNFNSNTHNSSIDFSEVLNIILTNLKKTKGVFCDSVQKTLIFLCGVTGWNQLVAISHIFLSRGIWFSPLTSDTGNVPSY